MFVEFLNKNRADFDTAAPTQKVWERIVRCLDSSDNLEKFIGGHRELFDDKMPVRVRPERTLNALGDPLETFILSHREQFDELEPSGKVLANLESAKVLGDCTLENFVAENRTAFDENHLPDEMKTWSSIEKALKIKNTSLPNLHVSWQRQILRAAAAIALLITCFGAGMWYAKRPTSESAMNLGDVSSEYAELEAFYQRDIAGKQEKLANFTAQNTAVQEDFVQLDAVMKELKNDLAHVPPGNREQIVRAMIENYKAKASILEKVLEHIDEQQQQHSNSKKHDVKNI